MSWFPLSSMFLPGPAEEGGGPYSCLPSSSLLEPSPPSPQSLCRDSRVSQHLPGAALRRLVHGQHLTPARPMSHFLGILGSGQRVSLGTVLLLREKLPRTRQQPCQPPFSLSVHPERPKGKGERGGRGRRSGREEDLSAWGPVFSTP